MTEGLARPPGFESGTVGSEETARGPSGNVLTLKKVAAHHVAEIAEPTESWRNAAAARFRSIRPKISECSGYSAYQ